MITADSVSSDKVTINAPVELVWYVLTDFTNYQDWNTFSPQVDTELILGAKVNMQVDLGNGLQKQIEVMQDIKVNECLAWGMVLDDKDTLAVCRAQVLERIDEETCTYITRDEFEGKLAPLVIEENGKAIELGFNACARGLKRQAEMMYGGDAIDES